MKVIIDAANVAHFQKEEGSVPPNVSNALRDLVRRSKKELKAAEAAQSK